MTVSPRRTFFGFVSVNYYQSATALDEAWDHITDEFEESEEDEPEEGYLGQADEEPKHASGCCCADCSGADLTAEND